MFLRPFVVGLEEGKKGRSLDRRSRSDFIGTATQCGSDSKRLVCVLAPDSGRFLSRARWVPTATPPPPPHPHVRARAVPRRVARGLGLAPGIFPIGNPLLRSSAELGWGWRAASSENPRRPAPALFMAVIEGGCDAQARSRLTGSGVRGRSRWTWSTFRSETRPL